VSTSSFVVILPDRRHPWRPLSSPPRIFCCHRPPSTPSTDPPTPSTDPPTPSTDPPTPLPPATSVRRRQASERGGFLSDLPRSSGLLLVSASSTSSSLVPSSPAFRAPPRALPPGRPARRRLRSHINIVCPTPSPCPAGLCFSLTVVLPNTGRGAPFPPATVVHRPYPKILIGSFGTCWRKQMNCLPQHFFWFHLKI
jgi:hypothetical protein